MEKVKENIGHKFEAYIGVLEGNHFSRNTFLGGFNSYDDVLEAYVAQRTDESPHLIMAIMDSVEEDDLECEHCGQHKYITTIAITEIEKK